MGNVPVWKRRLDFLSNSPYLRKRRRCRLLKPSKGKKTPKKGYQKPEKDRCLHGGIDDNDKDDEYYSNLIYFMNNLLPLDQNLFSNYKHGLKVSAVFHELEDVLTQCAKKLIIKCVQKMLEKQGINWNNVDFNYLLQLLKLLDPTVKLDQKNKKLYNEFINLNSFIEDYYKNTRNKTSIVNKIASDAELISEALISYLCKVHLDKASKENDSKAFEHYMQRAGNGLSEIIYSDIGMLLDVMWKLKGTCVLTSHDEEQYQQLRRMYTCNILLRNLALHESAITRTNSSQVMEMYLSTLLSEIDSSHFKEENNRLLKHYFQITDDKRPQDTLNAKFGGRLRLTIPDRKYSSDFHKYLFNSTFDKPQSYRANEYIDNMTELIHNSKETRDKFVRGYLKAYDKKLVFGNGKRDIKGHTNLVKDENLQPFDMETQQSVDAMKCKVAMIYQFICTSLGGENEKLRADVYQLAKDLQNETGSNCLDSIIRSLNSLQEMRSFSYKMYTGTANDKLEKVVKVMNDFLAALNCLVKIAKGNNQHIELLRELSK